MKSGLSVISLNAEMHDLHEKIKQTITQDVYEFYKKTHLIPVIYVDIPKLDVSTVGGPKSQVMGVPEVRVRIEFEVE